MNCGDYEFIWQAPDWPAFHYDLSVLAAPMAVLSHAQGLLAGRLADAGMAQRDHAQLESLVADVLKTSEIEGERLDADSVRSSLALRLGVDVGALAPADRHVDGVVEMVLDATGRSGERLTAERLFGWQAALFPTGYSGLSPIRVGAWRDDASGPMQVVSGPMGRQRVHVQAPPAALLDAQMKRFLEWVNQPAIEPPLLRAGIGHLWFVTLHPFDDGNGRVARAIGDLLLARADLSPQRFYSVSAQIQRERADYYRILERTQKSGLDITPWLSWFLGVVTRAVAAAHDTVDAVLARARFWQRWAQTPFNPRQIQMLTRLLDGFEGKLTSSKWAVIAKCSADTALRDIGALVELGVLRRTEGGGRSVGYELGDNRAA